MAYVNRAIGHGADQRKGPDTEGMTQTLAPESTPEFSQESDEVSGFNSSQCLSHTTDCRGDPVQRGLAVDAQSCQPSLKTAEKAIEEVGFPISTLGITPGDQTGAHGPGRRCQ
jgi:hypothetical protein